MERNEQRYYQIRKWKLWLMILMFVGIVILAVQREQLREKWLRKQERIEVSYEGAISEMEDNNGCYLCGSSSESLMSVFRGTDDIGIISLTDGYVLNFGLGDYKDSESSHITYTNMGNINYMVHSTPDRGMADIQITLPEKCEVDINFLERKLCQSCLNEVVENTVYSKWRYEKKEAVPFCMVDFQTMKVYPLQEENIGCMVRDYWVRMEHNGAEQGIEVYYVPKRKH